MTEYNFITLPKRAKDIAGKRFGLINVIGPVRNDRHDGINWLCICDCGEKFTTLASKLCSKGMKSCGCRMGNHSHGRSNSPEYRTWATMKQRCTSPSTIGWHIYGGRGISVCDRWLKFENFFEDMGKRPDGCSIDRINNDGDYTPENCRWSTRKEQMRNKNNNCILNHNGKSLCVSEWAEITGINQFTIHSRIKQSKWSIKKSLETPV